MKLRSIDLKNFGAMSEEHIDFHESSCLISGENGVGKTTLIDAVNTCLTLGGGASKYNAAGTGNKTHRALTRSLAAYILGLQTFGSLRPNRARCHVVVCYKAEAKDAFRGYLHIGFVAEAQRDPSGEPVLHGDAVGFCRILEEAEFPKALFEWDPKDEDEGGKRTYQKIFEANVKAQGLTSHISRSNGKAEHIKNCYRLAFQSEPKSVSSAHRRLCAPMETLSMKNATGSPKDFAVSAISSNFDASDSAKLRQAAIEYATLKELIEHNNALHGSALSAQDAAVSCVDASAVAAAAEAKILGSKALAEESKLDKIKLNIDQRQEQIQHATKEIEELDLGIKPLSNLLADLDRQEVAVRSSDGLGSLRASAEGLGSELSRARKSERDALSRWSAQRMRIAAMVDKMSKRSELSKVCAIARAALDKGDDNPKPALLALSEAANALCEGSQAQREILSAKKSKWASELAAAKERLADLEKGGARGALPHGIRHAVHILAEMLPASRPRVLCLAIDLRRGADPLWAHAVENKMGKARFTLVVEDGMEYKAQAILNARSKEFDRGMRPEVARNDLIAAEAFKPLPARSAMNLFASDDAQAMNYLRAKIGSLTLCDNEEQFKASARGLLLDGRSAESRELSIAADRSQFEPLFGANATSVAMDKIRAEIKRIEGDLTKATTELGASFEAIDAGSNLASALADELAYKAWEEATEHREKVEGAHGSAQESLAQAQAKMGQSPEEALDSIEAQRTLAQSKKQAAESSLRAANTLRAKCEGLLQTALESQDEQQALLESVRDAAANANAKAMEWGRACREEPERLLIEARALSEAQALHRIDEARKKMPALISLWRDACDRHNASPAIDDECRTPFSEAYTANPNPEDGKLLVDGARLAALRCEARKNIEMQKALEQAEINLESMFTGLICSAAINANIEVEDQVKSMNAIFSQISFRGVAFRLERKPLAKYAEALDSMRRISKMSQLSAGKKIDWSQAKPQDRELFKEILSIAAGADDEGSKRLQSKLHPIAQSDFDILAIGISEDNAGEVLYSLANNEAKSGGERESAMILLYCIIAASKAKALGADGLPVEQGMRWLQLDEAFDRLSMEYVGELMEFIENILGLQVIAMMPALKAPSIAPFFPLHLTVSPIGPAGKPFNARLTMSEIDRRIYQDLSRAQAQSGMDIAAARLVEEMDIEELLSSMPELDWSQGVSPEAILAGEIVSNRAAVSDSALGQESAS
jgi:hypothetical protein